jgi:aminoglycoside phosphotransferase (APT) family kinase protein
VDERLAALYAGAVAVRPLEGGVSAHVEALELADGRTLVVRRKQGVAGEFRVLRQMETCGVPVPRVHFVDEAAHALVMDHVDGVSGLEVPDVAERMADVLLRIHAAGVLHGDFWPGNTLWRGGELVAVLDWEDAGTGDPLADVGNARLELLWSHGADAMEAFTRRYGSPDPVALARWDLRADERSTSHIGEWGHDEATQARMRAARDEFVAAARRRLG